MFGRQITSWSQLLKESLHCAWFRLGRPLHAISGNARRVILVASIILLFRKLPEPDFNTSAAPMQSLDFDWSFAFGVLHKQNPNNIRGVSIFLLYPHLHNPYGILYIFCANMQDEVPLESQDPIIHIFQDKENPIESPSKVSFSNLAKHEPSIQGVLQSNISSKHMRLMDCPQGSCISI